MDRWTLFYRTLLAKAGGPIIIRVIEKKRKEREPGRAIMYYYSPVTCEKPNLVIFTNHIFSAYVLHKAKIQHYVIVFVTGRK